MTTRKSIASESILEALDKLASEIASAHADTSRLVLAAIANGGIPVNDMLRARLSESHRIASQSAIVDISFHRDDIGVNPLSKEVESTSLALDPEDSTIVLVDDVLFSGRSVRAALSELNTLGRPRKIELAVLVDRGNRRLPIEPNYVGIEESTAETEKVDVHLFPDDPGKSHIDILSS